MSNATARLFATEIKGDIGLGYAAMSGSGQIPIASANKLGGIKVGANLLIDGDGVLSVDTADIAEQDNTRPITSAAVHTVVGNIDALLQLL